MLQVLHDLKLFEDVSHFISFHALELVHVLHGVHLLSVLLLNDTHLKNRKSSTALHSKYDIRNHASCSVEHIKPF